MFSTSKYFSKQEICLTMQIVVDISLTTNQFLSTTSHSIFPIKLLDIGIRKLNTITVGFLGAKKKKIIQKATTT